MSFISNFLLSFTGISYFLIWILVLITTIQKRKEFDYLSIASIFLYAFVFLGLRDPNSGSDTIRYITDFNKIKSFGEFISSWDLLFNIYSLILSKIGNASFFIIANVLIQLSLLLIISSVLKIRNKSLLLLAYISFLPGFDMLTNGLRQGLSGAMALLIFVLAYYKQYIPKISLLVVLLFHKSTIIYAIFYLISKFIKERLILKIISFSFLIILSFILIWSIFDIRDNISIIFGQLTLPLFDSSFTIGDKFNIYLSNDSDMLIGIYKYYFLCITLFFLFHFYLLKKEAPSEYESLPILNIWFLTYFISIIYAVIWISPFSYRFMYIMFLPGLMSSILSLEIINKKLYYLIFLSVILIAAILTYGSNTFSEFKLNL